MQASAVLAVVRSSAMRIVVHCTVSVFLLFFNIIHVTEQQRGALDCCVVTCSDIQCNVEKCRHVAIFHTGPHIIPGLYYEQGTWKCTYPTADLHLSSVEKCRSQQVAWTSPKTAFCKGGGDLNKSLKPADFSLLNIEQWQNNVSKYK